MERSETDGPVTIDRVSRQEYYNDPHAPTANNIVPGASCFVLDDNDQVLLIQRADNGLWTVPGGAQQIGESLPQTAIRETQEETGILVEILSLVGVYTNPARIIAHDDGEVRQEFSVCFRGRPVSGSLTKSPESTDVRWVDPRELKQLPIAEPIKNRINHGYNATEPYLG